MSLCDVAIKVVVVACGGENSARYGEIRGIPRGLKRVDAWTTSRFIAEHRHGHRCGQSLCPPRHRFELLLWITIEDIVVDIAVDIKKL